MIQTLRFKHFLVGLFLIAGLSVFGQKTLTIELDIPWEDKGQGADWRFTSDYQNGADEPLEYSISQKVATSDRVSKATLTNVVYADVSGLPKTKKANNQKMLKNPRISSAGTEWYFAVDIWPYRLNPATQKIQRLVSADIEIDLAPRLSSKTIEWAEQSALAEGEWYKIAIAQDGIYRIDASLLAALGADVSSINPQQINVYGNGGQMLPFDNSVDRFDDPQKNAILVVGEEDGVFNGGDIVYFYGKGPDTWAFDESQSSTDRPVYEHEKHHYSDSAYYFIRVDDVDPKRIQLHNEPSGEADEVVNAFHDFQFVEKELFNLAKSGREYYGDQFETVPQLTFSFNTPNLLPQTARLDYGLVSRTLVANAQFTLQVGDQQITEEIDDTNDSETASIARTAYGDTDYLLTGNNTPIVVTYDGGEPDGIGWLDYLRINVTRSMTMAGSSMAFGNANANDPDLVYEYVLENASPISFLWDISNTIEPQAIQFEPGAVKTWKADGELRRRYIAASSGGVRTPSPIGAVANQNLHGLGNVDYVIVTRPSMVSAAEELADIHRDEGMDVVVVTQEQVFNEFSSGNPDVTATRMLMKMLYDRAELDPELVPRYLLLFGDGSYRNRGAYYGSGTEIMTYQSSNSLSPVNSYVSDDYFGLLSDDDVENLSDLLDIGVGRFAVADVNEALDAVAKVRRYKDTNSALNPGINCASGEASPFGSWRNIICFLADDQDGSSNIDGHSHMADSDQFAQKLETFHPSYNIEKIYMDAYTQESTPGGERYPDVNEAIRQRVQNGALLFGYVGHGGEKGFAHERVLDIPTIRNWTNANRLPVFMTATCELSRFDDPEFKSAGEHIFTNPDGGAIAMFTTTRIVFSSQNTILANAFYDNAFQDELYPDLRLGDIARLTKNAVTVGNKRNFSLLGDPALQMSYPKHNVETTTVNGTPIGESKEVLSALEEVTIEGFVTDNNGNVLEDFNGLVYPTVYDKKLNIQSLHNDPSTAGPFDFQLYKNILFRGKATVTNGAFSFTFLVPVDIAYNVGVGRISYYAVDTNAGQDAHGFNEQISIGGANPDAVADNSRPQIELFMNDSTFVAGGITDESPFLFARVSDESGLNTVGNGIGHDMVATLDGSESTEIVVNDFYESDADTYKSGTILYQYNELEDGPHNLTLKVWDVHNNSSSNSTDFVVASSAEIALDHVLNYPNPFTTSTEFMFEHNQSCQVLDVEVQVFTVSGKLVKTIRQEVINEGFRQGGVMWDGKDDYGDRIGRGVYVYRLKVTNPEIGESEEVFEKLVLLR